MPARCMLAFSFAFSLIASMSGARIKKIKGRFTKSHASDPVSDPQEEHLQIVVHPGEQVFAMTVTSTSTIESFYDAVSEKIAMPVDKFFMTYGEKDIPYKSNSSITFADYTELYNFQHTMHWWIKLRGLGGSAFSEIIPYEKFDFIVRILTTGGFLSSTCSGTVVKDIVITAAHCLKGKPKGVEVRRSDAPVIEDVSMLQDSKTGKLPFFNKLPNMVKKVDVVSYAQHPDYAQAGGPNDIGIIKLSESIETDTAVFLNKDRTTTGDAGIGGFGSDETGLNNGWPKLVRGSLTPCPLKDDKDKFMCLTSGAKVKAATCSGDSGAPVFYLPDASGKFLVTGINIAGIGVDGNSVKCTDENIQDKWSITLPLADYSDFLNEFAKANSDHGDILDWMEDMMFHSSFG